MPPFKPLHLHLQQFQCGGFDGFKRQIYRLFLQQAADAPPSRIAADGSEKLMPRPRQADSVTGKPIGCICPQSVRPVSRGTDDMRLLPLSNLRYRWKRSSGRGWVHFPIRSGYGVSNPSRVLLFILEDVLKAV